MKNTIHGTQFQIVQLLILLVVLILSGEAFSQSADIYQPGKIYVKLKPYKMMEVNIDSEGKLDQNKLSVINQITRNVSIKYARQPFFRTPSQLLKRVIEVELNDDVQVENAIATLLATGDVEYAERVPYAQLDYTPNDPKFSCADMWHLCKINAKQAWDVTKGDASVIVAVVDDAIDINHPDLSASIWRNSNEIPNNGIDDDNNGFIDDINGWDFGDNDNDPSPPNATVDHGTHVAGIVGATTDNGKGGASIGFNLAIMTLKNAKDATGQFANALEGVLYAADNGARVINMSWSMAKNKTLKAVMDYASDRGCILVAAAGNSGSIGLIYPAAYSNVIAVANTNSNDKKSSSSTYGPQVAVSAPGTDIYSCNVGQGYKYLSGTSMASPLVAGLCGLMLSVYPNVQYQDILNALQSTAVDIDGLNPAYAGFLGAGRINAEAAVAYMQQFATYAPLALFSTNYTSIVEGATVDFLDQTNYGPTSWSWNFGDGSPVSNLQHPSHTYNNVGTYTVTLIATNANGSDSYTQTSYIQVDPVSVCDTIANISSSEPLTLYFSPSSWGYLSGHNSYYNEAYAEHFSNYDPYTILGGATFNFYVDQVGNAGSTIALTVWGKGADGKPGNIMHTQDVMIMDIVDLPGQFKKFDVEFDTPLQITGDFFIGMQLSYADNDFLAIVHTVDDSVSTNTAYAFTAPANGSKWYGFDAMYGSSFALGVFPHLSQELPTANFTESSNFICDGQAITYDASGSSNAWSYSWTFPGGSPASSTLQSPTVVYSSAGIYTTELIVNGGCNTDIATSQVQVDLCTDVHDWSEDVYMHAYLDQIARMIRVTIDGSAETITAVQLINPLGAVIKQLTLRVNQNKLEFNAAQLTPGIYFVRVKGKEEVSAKVVIL